MIIVIPLGGTGERFKKCGYSVPKALIKTHEKEVIYHLLDNLNIKSADSVIIPYNKEYVHYFLENKLKKRYPEVKFNFIVLENNTRGAVETIYKGLQEVKIEKDTSVICIDCDNFYLTDIIKLWNCKNCVFTFKDKSEEERFSYINTKGNYITDIVEKCKISDLACTGAYGFSSVEQLEKYCLRLIKNNKTQKGEFYTSGLIKEMIDDGIEFYYEEIQNKDYFSIGTPTQLKEFNTAFLLDLDGTLVTTDHIYTDVWKNILKKYNLSIDRSFFDYFIKGKSDFGFMRYLISNIRDDEIKDISNMKDSGFIKLLSESKEEFVIDGVLEFLEKHKNSKIAIVTSCNKSSAEYILRKSGIENYVNVLVAADDCEKHKPNPEPYERAMYLLNVTKDMCVTIEDSMSGYTSAKRSGVNNVFIKVNESSSNEILSQPDIKFENYNKLDLLTNINNDLNGKEYYCDIIKKHVSHIPILNIMASNKDLKTGYICDIYLYNVTLKNKSKMEFVLKISNSDNELSKTAKKLNMYHNEKYFYDNIRDIVSININVPKTITTFIENNTTCIALENLSNKKGSFDIDLNKNITVLLNLVDKIHSMHTNFSFANDEEVLNVMKPLKKVKDIAHYQKLVENRFNKYLKTYGDLMNENIKNILINIHKNYGKISMLLSEFPLSFCHGDLKSPNIFYEDNKTPYFLDWQYIHLGKGISDIAFLLVESINFDKRVVELVINYYYKLTEQITSYSYEQFMKDFKLSLCMFPFFVCVWFGSEDPDKLLDKTFPIRFMKNVFKYYEEYLGDGFLFS